MLDLLTLAIIDWEILVDGGDNCGMVDCKTSVDQRN